MQILVNGIVTGLTVSVLAVAFAIVYLPARVFHVALGGIYAAVPFVAWAILRAGWPSGIAFAIALGAGVIISLACEAVNHAPLEKKGGASGAHLVSSLGIYIAIVQVVALIWGNETKVLRTGLDAVNRIGNVIVTQAQAIAAGVSLAILVAFYAGLHFSQLGLQLRALADNPKEFALRGYNVRRLRLFAFGISGFLGGVSSLLVAYDIGFDPNGGLAAVLLAVVATIVGGRLSFWGPIVGGVLIGIVRSQVVWYLSARWQAAVTFLILAVFLFVRPNGILGTKARLEAEES